MQGPNRAGRYARRALLFAAWPAVLFLAADVSPSDAEVKARASAAACEPPLSTLSPGGGGPSRFTMMLRVNKGENIDSYASSDEAAGGLRDRIRDRDIFVIHARLNNPSEAADLVAKLRESFPCNRIIALNGLGINPTFPGYALTLFDSPDVHALMFDWERPIWGEARETNPQMAIWKNSFDRIMRRINGWLATITGALAANPGGTPKRLGLVSQFARKWHYGKIARAIDGHNRRVGSERGYQVVMTQVACQRAAGRGLRGRASRVFKQYLGIPTDGGKGAGRKRNGKRLGRIRNLGFQVSFTSNPNPRDPMPALSVSPATAAKCVHAGLKAGGGAFLLWAPPESIAALFDSPRMARLRPVS